MVQTVELPNGEVHEFPDEATPQQIKGALSGVMKQSQPQQPGLMDNATNAAQTFNKTFEGAVRDPLLGFVQGISNIPSATMNLLNKTDMFGLPERFRKDESGQERQFPSFDVAPHNLGSTAGEAASMVLNPASLAGAPKAINALRGAKSNIGESIVNNPLAKKAVESANAFKPGAEAERLTQHLSQGKKTYDQNMESLVKDIQKKHNEREAEAGIHFDHALKQAGHENIYEKPDPLVTTRLDEAKSILGKIKGLNIGELAKNFENKQSFSNAHQLQSELGHWIGEFDRKPHKTAEELADLKKIKSIRDEVKNGISNFLERRDRTSNIPIKPSYERGRQLYDDNVSHFLSDPKLRDIVRGGSTAVERISSIFKTPKNIVNRKTGEVKLGPINRMMQDLPNETKNKILFDAIGGESKNPLDLLNKLKKAENKGFGSYFTPETKEIMNNLEKKIQNKNMLSIPALGKLLGYASLGTAAATGATLGAKKIYSEL